MFSVHTKTQDPRLRKAVFFIELAWTAGLTAETAAFSNSSGLLWTGTKEQSFLFYQLAVN